MRRREQAQGLMKFEEVYGHTVRGELSQAEAAEVWHVGAHFRRWRDRFEADRAKGLYDRRLGRVSARRAPVDEVTRVLALFRYARNRSGDHPVEHLRSFQAFCRATLMPATNGSTSPAGLWDR